MLERLLALLATMLLVGCSPSPAPSGKEPNYDAYEKSAVRSLRLTVKREAMQRLYRELEKYADSNGFKRWKAGPPSDVVVLEAAQVQILVTNIADDFEVFWYNSKAKPASASALDDMTRDFAAHFSAVEGITLRKPPAAR
jgi:hypothetical protein